MLDVTLLISTRERFSAAIESLNSILSHTASDVSIIYADIGAPEKVATEIKALLATRNGCYHRFELPIMPQEARIALIQSVESKYVVFIDNDVLVEPQWLEKLVDCAEQTKAGLVGPLYLWSDGKTEPKVHMAGGVFREFADETGKHFTEQHYLINANPSEVSDLVRKPVDFLEYHCMLARTSFVQEVGVLDPSIATVHEHIDLGLKAKLSNIPIMLEPNSRINYLGKRATISTGDIKFYRRRWDLRKAMESLDSFAEKWGYAKDRLLYEGMASFLKTHRESNDVLSIGATSMPLDRALLPGELAQSRVELISQLKAAGYHTKEVSNIAKALTLAMVLSDGVYRCDGRPFLAHVVGTASALVHARAKSGLVSVGLLHAAYTHRPTKLTVQHVQNALLGIGSWVEGMVVAYSRIGTKVHDGSEDFNTADLALAMVQAANEIDMRLSGEYASSGRHNELTTFEKDALCALLERSDITILATTLRSEQEFNIGHEDAGIGSLQRSFRIGPSGTNLIPVDTFQV